MEFEIGKINRNGGPITVKLSNGRTATVRRLPPSELGALLLLGTVRIDGRMIKYGELTKADVDRLAPHVEWATGITAMLTLADRMNLRK